MSTYVERCMLCAAALFAPSVATAGENGGSAYVHGAEGWLTGILPPPGDYLLSYTNYYHAGRLNDGRGKSRIRNFEIEAISQTLRYIHVTDRTILGGTLAFQVIVPAVDLKVRAGGETDHRAGLGDITVTPLILGWHRGKWHYGVALGLVLPTGRYDRRAVANIGRNYLTVEPVVAITYLDPKGPELSVKLIYHATSGNGATDYRSGDEVHADFVAGWNFKDLAIGVGGYYSRQIQDDRQKGLVVGDGNRGELLALGPTAKYQWGRVPVMLTWQHDLKAEHRPQGDKLWLKIVLPLR